MMNTYYLQLCVNFPLNPEKDQAMQEAVKRAGAILMATAELLKDGPSPQLKMYSDNWVSGPKDIELFGDVLAEGQRQLKEAGASLAVEEEVSDSLREAMRDMAKEQGDST